MRINWGDVPTWVAVIVATFGGFVALRQLRQQQKVIGDEIERNKARDALLDGQLRELQGREVSRQREQAEAVDVTWTDPPRRPGKSIVVVINGSRRPIKMITCWVYPDFLSLEKLPSDYGEEMFPAMVVPPVIAGNRTGVGEIGGYTLAKPAEYAQPWVDALRAGGRAGFQIPKLKTDCIFGEARIRFTDDAGQRWSLSSGLSLSQIEPVIPAEEMGLDGPEDEEPSATASK